MFWKVADDRRLCSYTRKLGSEENRISAYFTQCNESTMKLMVSILKVHGLRINQLETLMNKITLIPPQPAFTCLKLTIETLEQSVKCVQS